MIPKFRVWDKQLKIIRPVTTIDFDAEEVSYRLSEEAESYCHFTDCVLMQSTGLKDKNGKEVFEGDIVHWKDLETSTNVPFEEIVKVEYSDEFLKWIGVEKCGSDKDLYDFTDTRELEVIGNIYENLEWLRIGE